MLTLSFASGERTDMGYIGESDPNDPNSLIGLYDDNNRFWVLKDEHPTGTGAFPSDLPIMEAPDATHPTLTDITNLPTDNVPTDAGYFFRVPDGEKFITNHLVFGGLVLTLSYQPAEADLDPSDDGCTLSGQTNQWAWNLASGGGELRRSRRLDVDRAEPRARQRRADGSATHDLEGSERQTWSSRSRRRRRPARSRIRIRRRTVWTWST